MLVAVCATDRPPCGTPAQGRLGNGLNLSTSIGLYNYGYCNVYELGPRIDPTQSRRTGQVSTSRRTCPWTLVSRRRMPLW
jgi:hypothetical protein